LYDCALRIHIALRTRLRHKKPTSKDRCFIKHLADAYRCYGGDGVDD
jgi:hypothetical protein